MSVVAVYNMKGGVGKTTTAVNLSYLAAAAGQRVLLWDLDPQAASSFALRIRPRVAGFGKQHLESGRTLAAAVRATDYDGLDLLPADFAYRKFDRLLAQFGKPERVVTAILETFNGEYDTVFLDCPAGFSLLTEGVFAAADAVLAPTIPTVLSLRGLVRGIKWADRSHSRADLAAFFSMVDRRKPLHRRACEWSAQHPDVLLAQHVPYASIVEQMTVRRMPLAAFAPREAATKAFGGIWTELQTRLRRRAAGDLPSHDRRERLQGAIESLTARLESPDRAADGDPDRDSPVALSALEKSAVEFVHRFDTDAGDLQRCGYVLELRERGAVLQVVAARSDGGGAAGADTSARAQMQIDGVRATQILSGALSPLDVFDATSDGPAPPVLETVHGVVHGRRLRRVDSHVSPHACAERAAHVI